VKTLVYKGEESINVSYINSKEGSGVVLFGSD
jgi:hypothetical protein